MTTTFACKDCPDRKVGCHGQCEKYKKQCEELQRKKEKTKHDRDFEKYKAERNERFTTASLKYKKHRDLSKRRNGRG